MIFNLFFPSYFASSLGLGIINPAILKRSDIICPLILTSKGELECKLNKMCTN